ncbi:unnamed protein product [Parnassius apollo]|uniref:(apollo) hypothetical protein n=1 Tax=Parnassius apollo TaxID=110799 RepID=A0A8S3YE91_PARAO|nr:unnamed protein product [Parnassius apollo]
MRLYKSLERPEVCGAGPGLDQADTVAFWRGLWSEPVNHSEGPWMEVVASQNASVTPMDPVTITPEDVAEAVRRAPNWKSPRLDGLHHYWLKGFVVVTLCSPDSLKRLSIRSRSRASSLLGSLIWFIKIRIPQTRANTATSRVYPPYIRH